MRCFIGFELAPECLERIRVVIAPFHERLTLHHGWPVRLVPPGNWHMTCLFFSDLPSDERAVVWEEVLRNVSARVWDDMLLPWEGLKLWPTPRKPAMICQVGPVNPEVGRWPLVQRLDEAPFNKGDVEHLRQWRPHITLMRFRGNAGKPYAKEWQVLADRVPKLPPTAIRFSKVSLFLSDVSAAKPIYTREFTAPLGTRVPKLIPRGPELLVEK